MAPVNVTGSLRVRVSTDFPERYKAGAGFFIKGEPFFVEEIGWQRGFAIVKFRSIDNQKQAAALKGCLVEIPASELYPLAEGSYYHFQIIGLRVVTTGGEPLGFITEVIPGPSCDNYVMPYQGREVLIPAIEDVIKDIDLNAKEIKIEPIKGLLE